MNRKHNWLSFEEAWKTIEKDIENYNINNVKDWKKYCKSGKKIDKIPSCPNKVYKNKGWIGWRHWLRIKKKEWNGSGRRRKVNDNYFKKWSCDMAYILGFWFADGNINKERNDFSISQHQKDKYLLSNILKEMDSDYPLIKSKNNFSFHITSKIIVEDIIELGGKVRKSLDINFPDVPKKYLSDFVRGLWDGDGSVNKHGIGYRSSFTSGSEKFIYRFRKILRENIPDLHGGIYKIVRKKEVMQSNGKLRTKDQICYYLEFCRNDTRRLRDFIYNDFSCFKLMRKYELFLLAGEITPSKNFLSFKKAKIKTRKAIRELGIESRRKWCKYFKLGKIPKNIPCCPHRVYKNKGWVDWYDWLGKERPFKI